MSLFLMHEWSIILFMVFEKIYSLCYIYLRMRSKIINNRIEKSFCFLRIPSSSNDKSFYFTRKRWRYFFINKNNNNDNDKEKNDDTNSKQESSLNNSVNGKKIKVFFFLKSSIFFSSFIWFDLGLVIPYYYYFEKGLHWHVILPFFTNSIIFNQDKI